MGMLALRRIQAWTIAERKRCWEFKCPDCGKIVVLPKSYGAKTSRCMECFRKHRVACLTTHGESKSNIYKRWYCIRDRCVNPNNHAYKYYGGKGIKLCNEWDTWEKFKHWAFANGYKENLTIDRINSNKDYEPTNCRWVTQSENSANTKKERVRRAYRYV